MHDEQDDLDMPLHREHLVDGVSQHSGTQTSTLMRLRNSGASQQHGWHWIRPLT